MSTKTRFGEEPKGNSEMAYSKIYFITFKIFSKGTKSQYANIEKFSLNFSSSSFVIRVNLLHPSASLFLYGLLSPLWCFSILVNNYFQVSFNLKV